MNAIVRSAEDRQLVLAKAIDQSISSITNSGSKFSDIFIGLISGQEAPWIDALRAKSNAAIAESNAISKALRKNPRADKFKIMEGLAEKGEISKANMDVGTLTNFSQVTGGQSLGYVSLDTQMARETVRPNSFTLYQCLDKSAAFQVVDFWPTATETGGGLPGTAFQSYSSVSTGNLATSAGLYSLNNVTLKLAVNGRAITTALAAQNSFVDIQAQENINAALTVLESVNWSCYWGNATLFPNQFPGLYTTITTDAQASGNVFNFQTYSDKYATAQGWTGPQTMYNLIYEAAAQITDYRQNGRVTHAFMSPTCAASLQGLVTTLLNNILNQKFNMQPGIIVDGDLQGMRTRFGEIQFPVDMFITARDKPAQSVVYENGTNAATLVLPTKPVSVVGSIVTNAASLWTTAFVASSGIYSYAVASLGADMSESTLTYISSGQGVASTNSISGVTAAASSNAYRLTITPPGAADAAAFRVYRSGLGYAPASSGTPNVNSYRYIGVVAANASTPVTFDDLNAYIPGSETVFLLDLDENDKAVDYRFLLPLTRVELFAQNLFMPWAVCSIGALRVRIPKFNGIITNYIPQSPDFNPLTPNTTAN